MRVTTKDTKDTKERQVMPTARGVRRERGIGMRGFSAPHLLIPCVPFVSFVVQ